MFKLLKKYKKDVTKKALSTFVLIMIFTSVILIVGATYAADYGAAAFTIVFNRAEGNEVMKTCHTDENGKLDADCLNIAGTICSDWSTDIYYGGAPQKNGIHISKFADMTFTENKNYYCVAKSSGKYDMACYVCKSDETIMHWAANGNANENCSAGYYKSTVITEEGKCFTVVPDSCYVCKTDSNIMKWDNNGEPNNECSSGYILDPDAKNIDQCKTIIPDACYICKTDKNVMKWDNDGSADNSCSSGYTKTNTPKSDCVPIENPPTNDIMIFMVWVIGIASIVYSFCYYKKNKF